MNLKCVNRWALALAAVVALTACGGDESGSATPPTTAVRAVTTTADGSTAQAPQTTPPEPAAPAASPSTAATAPPASLSADAVAQRFWDATFAADRDLALSVGVPQVYEQLRASLSGEESVVDPDRFSFLGCDLEQPGTHSCEYRSTADSIVDRISLSVFDDGRGSYYVGAMSRVCTHELYGPCP